MRTAIGLFAALLVGQSALAADIFVRSAQGDKLTHDQSQQVTGLVKRAVQNMPEHHLVTSESEADFTLQPSLVNRDGDQVLRVDKMKDGQLIASSERAIASVDANRALAIDATQDALNKDTYVTADNFSPETGAPDDQLGTDPSLRDAPGSVSGITQDDESMVTTEDMNAYPPKSQTTDPSIAQNQASPQSTDDSMMDQGQAERGMDPTVSGSESQLENRDNPVVVQPPMPADSPSSVAGGESRAVSPRGQVMSKPSYWNAGIGPAFPVGLRTDNIMYNVHGGYNYNFSDALTGKAFGDLNLSGGANSAQFITLGLGADIYPVQNITAMGRPYLTGDVGYAFTRNADNNSQDAPQIGAGAGFKFQAQQLGWDVNLHYSILTAQIDGDTPQVFGVRAAVNF